MYSKKGISPLIASVLLIAFAVTLFLIISTWVQRSVVEPGLEEGGDRIESSLVSSEIFLEIGDVELVSLNILEIEVDNVGDVTVDDVLVRVEGEQGVDELRSLGASLKPLDRNTFQVTFDPGKTGIVEKVSIIPVVDSSNIVASLKTKKTKTSYNFVGGQNHFGFESGMQSWTSWGSDLGGSGIQADSSPVGKNHMRIHYTDGMYSENFIPDTQLYAVSFKAKVESGTLHIGNGNVEWWGLVSSQDNGNIWKDYTFIHAGGPSDCCFHFGTYSGNAYVDDISVYLID